MLRRQAYTDPPPTCSDGDVRASAETVGRPAALAWARSDSAEGEDKAAMTLCGIKEGGAVWETVGD
jgi:hypothetical protein